MSSFVCGGRTAERPRDDKLKPMKKNAGPSNPDAREWENEEVLQWLRKIGHDEYESQFIRSNTNGKRLLQLKQDDLKKMGIQDPSDQKSIVKEINRLNKSQRSLHKHDSGKDNRDGRDRNDRDRDDRYDDREKYRKSKSPNGGHGQRSQLQKSQSDYAGRHQYQMRDHHNHQQQRGGGGGGMRSATNAVEFNTVPPLGIVDKDNFSEERKLDKQKYLNVWQGCVGNQEILLQTRYNIIMKQSKLPQQDLSIIWRMATNYNGGRCQFEQFADICKLLYIALYSGVPLYLINTQKLIWYHPDAPGFLSEANQRVNANVNVMAAKQLKQNTVAFRGLPPAILESDDRLMKFAELALQEFEPVHFEINENTLIATFKVQITPDDLQALRESSIRVIQNQFHIMHVNGVNIVMSLQVEFPTDTELGLTPGGIPPNSQPNPPPQQQQQQAAPHGYVPAGPYTMGASHPHGSMRAAQPQPQPQQPPMHNHYHPQTMGNGYHHASPHPPANGYGAPYSTNSNPPPPPVGHMTNNGVHNLSNGMAHTNGVNGHPSHLLSPQQTNRIPPQHQQYQRPQHQATHVSQNSPYNAPYNVVHNSIGNSQATPDAPQMMTQQKKDELLSLLLSEDFYEDFRVRTQLDSVIPNHDTKIRTKAAMQLIASLRGVPLRTIQYLDKGVKELQQTTKAQLKAEMSEWTLTRLALILGIPQEWIPEVYKGIIIEGLPEIITQDDDTIRKLDSEVLYSFVVSHIEVVDNVLRITFKKDVSQQEIDKLRRLLKSFLRDIMKIEKKLMKCVSLIPHTRETWRGETTTTEYDDIDVAYAPN